MSIQPDGRCADALFADARVGQRYLACGCLSTCADRKLSRIRKQTIGRRLEMKSQVRIRILRRGPHGKRRVVMAVELMQVLLSKAPEQLGEYL